MTTTRFSASAVPSGVGTGVSCSPNGAKRIRATGTLFFDSEAPTESALRLARIVLCRSDAVVSVYAQRIALSVGSSSHLAASVIARVCAAESIVNWSGLNRTFTRCITGCAQLVPGSVLCGQAAGVGVSADKPRSPLGPESPFWARISLRAGISLWARIAPWARFSPPASFKHAANYALDHVPRQRAGAAEEALADFEQILRRDGVE